MLLVNFLEKGTTIKAAVYGSTLERLKAAIKHKRPGLMTYGVYYSSTTMVGLTVTTI